MGDIERRNSGGGPGREPARRGDPQRGRQNVPRKSPSGRPLPAKTKGLPPLKEPVLSDPANRAVLVACSDTGRASWAEFQKRQGPRHSAYVFLRNVPAVPDLDAARGGGSGQSLGSKLAGAMKNMPKPGATAELGTDEVQWGGWRCGVCDVNRTPVRNFQEIFIWRCGNCSMLHCPGGFQQQTPGSNEEWYVFCPACGHVLSLSPNDQVGTIGSFDTQSGRSPSAAEEGRQLGGGGPRGSRRGGSGGGRPPGRGGPPGESPSIGGGGGRDITPRR